MDKVAVQNVDKPVMLGVDLGGTKVNVGLVDRGGRVLFSHKSLIHASKKPEKVLVDVHRAIDSCCSRAGQEAEAVGVGVAGQVDQRGFVRGSQNLGWQNVPIKRKLEKMVGLPVAVTNDVNAATLGEWRYGSGRGVDDLAVLFVGTGIGGGIITGGKLLTGCSNSGGELGHITVVYDGRQCHCPNRGCLEAYAGGWAIAELAQQAVRAAPKRGQRLVSLAGTVEEITAATVCRAYREGDMLAQRLVEETGRYLAAGVVSIVNAFNPCVMVLGGGVIEGIPELIQTVSDVVPAMALEASVEEPKIVKASLGADAGVIGAAVLAQDLLK